MTKDQQQLIGEIRERNAYRKARRKENAERKAKPPERQKKRPGPIDDIDTLLRILDGVK